MGKFREKLKERKGFTLVEMIIVIGILAVLGGVIGVGVHGYLVNAYMTRVNDTAKTVFLAAQNYITEQKQLGKLDEFNEQAENYGNGGALNEDTVREILLANHSNDTEYLSDYEKKYRMDHIRYLTLNEGEQSEGSQNPIDTIVRTYLDDTDILEHTFLMEYDTKTGVVRAVFYTEKAGNSPMEYGTDHSAKTNVIIRNDSEALKEKRQGYYGVESTSILKTDVELFAPKDVFLANGERLYAQWTEANYLSQKEIAEGKTINANDAFTDIPELKNYLVYDVQVCRAKDGEVLYSVSGLKASEAEGSTLAQADAVAGDGENDVIFTYDDHSNTYQLLLDDIDHSIYEVRKGTYHDCEVTINGTGEKPDIKAEDMLICSVKVRLEEHDEYEGESDFVKTNQQSANYAGGDKTVTLQSGTGMADKEVYGNGNLNEDGSDAVYGKAFSIDNARHLNNMRYADGSSSFIQTSDIDWEKPETDRVSGAYQREKTDFVPLSFGENTSQELAGGAVADTSFFGTFKNGYQAGDDFVISHLNIEKLSGSKPEKNVGMFRKNKGTIDGLHIKDSTVKGAYLTGIVTGSNSGELQSIKVENSTVEAAYYAGGITGYNYKKGILKDINAEILVRGVLNTDVELKKEAVDAAVEKTPDYGWYLGGIAGVNRGKIKETQTNAKVVEGVACVGGIAGANIADEAMLGGLLAETGGEINHCVNRNTLDTAKKNGVLSGEVYQNFGGIAGDAGKNSTVLNCKNLSTVFVERDAVNPEYIENIGGIVGSNRGRIESCIYMSETAGSTKAKTITEECFKKAALGGLPVYTGIYVGGIAGVNDSTGEIVSCGSMDAVVTGYRYVGGIAGKNQGSLKNSGGDVSGLTETEKQYIKKVSGVVAATEDFAGGIAGSNEQAVLENYHNEANVFAGSLAGGITGANGALGVYHFTAERGDANYYGQLVEPDFSNKNFAITIKSCENEGFVYALKRYAGGITGVNYGVISSSNSKVEWDENNNSYLDDISRADCAGGIAGANFGKIKGDSVTYPSTIAGVCGYDFVGGVAGINVGTIVNIQKVSGNVWAKGSCVGGIIGLNMNAESLSNIAFTEAMQVKGGYFVGGIIGTNVTKESENPQIKGMITKNTDTKVGTVRGTGYVGGILGYNTTLSEGQDVSVLFAAEIEPLKEQVYENYSSKADDGMQQQNRTVFKECQNHAEVYADRYLGGIVGYNGEDSPLYIIDSINYGKVEVTNPQKTGDGFYFIGGITGRNSSSGVIHKCINDGSVKSPSTYLGGICEVNEGYIQFCTVGRDKNYNEEGISGENSVGGLVGLNSNHVVSCVTSSYAKVKGGNNTGGIVGTNDSNGIITGDRSKAKTISGLIEVDIFKEEKCVASGSVIGKNNTGGIVGQNQGQVEQVYLQDATVSGWTYVGGFIGSNEGTIKSSADIVGEEKVICDLESHAKKVVGRDEVGGIVGRHNATRIENCTNYGEVQIETDYVGAAGGITGSVAENITIAECENYGIVTANKQGAYAGGITGKNKGTVTDCIHYGTATSTASKAGGIVADNMGTVENCSNYGSVTGSTSSEQEAAIGGVVGKNEKQGIVKNCGSFKNEGNAGTSSMENQIVGSFIVGGIIGCNEGILDNTTEETLHVTVGIKTAETSLQGSKIGGVIGKDMSAKMDTLKDYVFEGSIEVTKKGAAKKQAIGGIIGEATSGYAGKSAITLENCIMAGQIRGIGNHQGTESVDGGVGGLVGISHGAIIVYPNKEGIYTSVTKDAVIEGDSNIGGLAGKLQKGHKLLLKVEENSEPQTLAELSVNLDSTEENDIYYTNIAEVSGGIRVGGCYGYLSEYDGELTHYKNAGFVLLNQNCTINQAVGGIVGSAHFTKVNKVSYLQNTGTIGSKDTSGEILSRGISVGGLIGNFTKSSAFSMEHLYNKGEMNCGTKAVGGLIGHLENTGGVKGTLTLSENNGKISSKGECTGGLIGEGKNIEITDGKNRGEVFCYDKANVGGVIGSATSVNISKTQNLAAVICERSSLASNTRVGGIAGILSGTSVLANCENIASITGVNAGKVGGIAGYANGKATIRNCSNHEEGIIKAAESIGGILGEASGINCLIAEENENHGDLYGKYRTGGVIGTLWAEGLTNTSGSSVKNCRNDAVIYPAILGSKNTGNSYIHEIGGCIGYIKTKVTVENFTNSGTICMDKNLSEKKVTCIYNIGGIAGRIDGAGIQVVENTDVPTLLNCVNEGSIEIAESSNDKTLRFGGVGNQNELGGIGGIAGVVSGKGALIKSCENRIDIDFSESYTQSNTAVSNNWDTYYKNYDTQYTGKMIANIGGIAGRVGTDGKLLYCVNQGNVITAVQNGCNIGGIAGESSGLIYSCRTENPAGAAENKKVIGKEAVGGIVGNAKGITSKLTSLVREDYSDLALMQNTFDVCGVKMVGGIAGRMSSATIQSTVNSDGVQIIRYRSSETHRAEDCAGGVAGFAKKGKEQGVIANCYNFSKVRFETGEDESKLSYLGGLIGYRDRDTEELSNKIKTAVSVKDSFYLQGSGYDNIDASKPKEADQNQVLAIGNEPMNAYAKDKEDQMFGKKAATELDTEERFLWTKDAYVNMYQLLHGNQMPDESQTANWADMNQVIKDIVRWYDQYKLPVPETDSITAGDEFNYDLHITKMPGFCDYIELFLFDGDTAEIDEEHAIYRSGKLSVTMDGQIQEDIIFNAKSITNYQKYIGRPIQVGLKAYGVSQELSDGTGITYSTDSDLEIVKEFVLMPALVRPQMEEVSQSGAELTFRITNWEEYKERADEIYTAMQNLPEEIRNLPIYERLLDGLLEFNIKDYYQVNKGGTDTKVSETWEITEDMIDAESGTFVIDYRKSALVPGSQKSYFDTYRQERQWHLWKVQAVAEHTDWSVEKEEVLAGELYRYTSSLTGNCEFQIQAEVPLNPPTELAAIYAGGMDAQGEEKTPSFTLSFKRSTSPEEAISHYLIKVTNPANGRTASIEYVPEPIDDSTTDSDNPEEEPDTTCYATLDKETLLGTQEGQLALDLSPEGQPEKLTFTVQTIKNDSEAAAYFLDSKEVSCEIPLIKKGYPVEEPITITVENESTPDQWLYRWTDELHGEIGDVYLVSCQIISGDTVVKGEPVETTDPYYSFDASGVATGDTITFSVVRKGKMDGETVTRLNSDAVVLTKVKGEKLPQVTDVTTVYDRMEGDELVYLVDFTVPQELTPEVCSGFTIRQVTNDENEQTLSGPVTISYNEDRPLEVRIPVSGNAGKTFYTIVTANSLLDESANSDGATSTTVVIPSTQLSQPENVTAKVFVTEEDQTTVRYDYDLTTEGEYSFLKDEFAAMTYHLAWELNGDTANVKEQYMKLIRQPENPDEEPLEIYQLNTKVPKTSVDITAAEIAEYAGVDLADYAGETLQLKVASLPVDASASLPSDETVVNFYVPKIRLESPVAAENAVLVALEQEDGSYIDVAEDAQIPTEDYAKLAYTLNWSKPEITGNETGVEIRITYANPDYDESVPDSEAELAITTGITVTGKSGNAIAQQPDGSIYIPWEESVAEDKDAAKDLDGILVLRGLPTELSGTEIKIYLKHTTAADPAAGGEKNPKWAASEETEVVFTMPGRQLEGTVTFMEMQNEGAINKEKLKRLPRPDEDMRPRF